MKKHTSTQTIYKRFKQFIILGIVAILTVTTTATASDYNTIKSLAEQGNGQAQILLGEMYQGGYGGATQDEKKALYWFRKSAESGNSQGMAQYGYMLHNGIGGARLDKNKGLYYIKKSARMGNQDAQIYLKNENIKY